MKRVLGNDGLAEPSEIKRTRIADSWKKQHLNLNLNAAGSRSPRNGPAAPWQHHEAFLQELACRQLLTIA